MLTTHEFTIWFADYRGRFPAVGDYVDRQDLPSKLLDTWHQCVSAFDAEILRDVTSGILNGDFEPVANVQLGQFGNEIRKLCRAVLDRRREREHRQEWKREAGKQYQPLFRGRLVHMYRCAEALRQLIGGEAADADAGPGSWDDAPMTPARAAIVLADDHSTHEEKRCLAILETVGLTWQQVEEAAAHVGALLQEDSDGEVGS